MHVLQFMVVIRVKVLPLRGWGAELFPVCKMKTQESSDAKKSPVKTL